MLTTKPCISSRTSLGRRKNHPFAGNVGRLRSHVKGRFDIAERRAQIDKYKRPLARQATTEGNVPESAKWMDESRVGGCGHYHARSVPFHHRIGRLSSASQKQTAIVQCGSFQLVCVHFHSGARRSSLASSKMYREKDLGPPAATAVPRAFRF